MADRAIARLRRLDSCAVSDACDRLGIEGRVVTTLRPVTGPSTIAGRVITVELGPPAQAVDRQPDSGSGPRSMPDGAGEAEPGRHLCAAAADSATVDDVIVVAHQGRGDCAGWGGNLARGAKARGSAGTIVDGAVRDVDEAIGIGYPTFATGSTPRTARGRTEEKRWGRRIEVAGMAVDHGDYVVADSTGVVFIAATDLHRVLDAADAIAAREAAMASAIDDGTPLCDAMGAEYENMLDL